MADYTTRALNFIKTYGMGLALGSALVLTTPVAGQDKPKDDDKGKKVKVELDTPFDDYHQTIRARVLGTNAYDGLDGKAILYIAGHNVKDIEILDGLYDVDNPLPEGSDEKPEVREKASNDGPGNTKGQEKAGKEKKRREEKINLRLLAYFDTEIDARAALRLLRRDINHSYFAISKKGTQKAIERHGDAGNSYLITEKDGSNPIFVIDGKSALSILSPEKEDDKRLQERYDILDEYSSEGYRELASAIRERRLPWLKNCDDGRRKLMVDDLIQEAERREKSTYEKSHILLNTPLSEKSPPPEKK